MKVGNWTASRTSHMNSGTLKIRVSALWIYYLREVSPMLFSSFCTWQLSGGWQFSFATKRKRGSFVPNPRLEKCQEMTGISWVVHQPLDQIPEARSQVQASWSIVGTRNARPNMMTSLFNYISRNIGAESKELSQKQRMLDKHSYILQNQGWLGKRYT